MSYDALVWLLVGLGVGVAASLMLFLGYSMLEHGRLSRRLRRAHAAAVAATPAAETLPVAPKTSLLARPAPRAEVAAKPTASAKPANDVRPAVGSIRATDDKPARPTLPVAAPQAKPAEVAEPRPVGRVVETPAIAAPPPAMVAEVKRPKSVEAMFAEAFANDRLAASPEPDEAAGAAKPVSGKPPG